MMVPYSVNSKVRGTVIVFIAIISLCITIAFNNVFIAISKILSIWTNSIIIIDREVFYRAIDIIKSLGIEPLGIFGGLYWFYNEHFWTKFYKLHKVPNLNGKWKGQSISDGKDPREVEVEILQNWNKISIKTTLNDKKSTCRSTIAAIEEDGKEIKIKYAYTNPDLGDGDKYIGYNELIISDNKVRGGYFTSKPSTGKFYIERGM